jgi:hypothetical protein
MKLLFKIMIALPTLTYVTSASADLATPKTAQIHCQGSAATLDVVAATNGALSFKLLNNGKVMSGTIAPELSENYYAPGALISYCNGCESSPSPWLSLGASVAKNIWVPAHSYCQATRTIEPCVTHEMPGMFQHAWFINFDLMLTQTGPGTYAFSHMEYDFPEGKAAVTSLGTDTVCKVSIQ